MDKLNGKDLQGLIVSAGNNLSNNHHRIDALNVFPVPDGDTGTNMNLTFQSGMEQAANADSTDFDKVAKKFSKGLLMGARGNSGVILSQVFRGFAKSVDGKAEVTPADLAEAFTRGTKVAYKAIMRPVEGTILTVVRESSEKAEKFIAETPDATVEAFMDVLVREAEESLKRTPDLLPVLKEVGVLDSGGAGYVEVIRGFQAALKGNPVELQQQETEENNEFMIEETEAGYRTQYILKLDRLAKQDPSTLEKLQLRLQNVGDDLTFYEDDGSVYVSVNTVMPGQALNEAQRFGTFEKIQIENLSGQLSESIIEQRSMERTKYAVIAVASGEGLATMFKDLGVNVVVTGGQTMNPSTESFASAIKKINAEHVFILPNNGNIILAAKQTKHVVEGTDIHVIETRSIPEGLSAMIAFDPEGEVEDNEAAMSEAAAHVVTGSVTYAIKDTSIDGVEIHKDEYMGIMGKTIIACTPSVYKSARALLDAMLAGKEDDYSVVTLIGGEGTDDSDMELLRHYMAKKYPDFEVESYQGGQPVYSFIIGLD